MKNLSLLSTLFLALVIFGLSSCKSDDDFTLNPTVAFEEGVDLISTDTTLAPGASFTVRITATKGDNPINSLTIKEDGVNVTADRITIDGLSTANNPQLVTGDDTEGFTWDVTIVAHTDEADVPYEFIVTDDKANTGSATLYINTDPNTGNQLSLSLVGTSTLTVNPNSAVNIKLTAAKGAADLATIGVYENGTLISDLTRIDYDGANFTENPQPLNADDQNGFTEEPITVRLGMTGGTYTFEVTDANGSTASVDVVINVGTPATEITGVLLNSAGPAGTGGLDLDSGTGTGSSDPTADIKDQGIDTSLPNDQNWIQKISGANTAVLKYAGNLPDGSGYDDITTKEEIVGAFANSEDLSNGVSDVVVVGDEFVVESNGNYFFLKVTDINVTADNNEDSYTFSIKK